MNQNSNTGTFLKTQNTQTGSVPPMTNKPTIMTEQNNHNHNHIQSSPIHYPGWKYLLLLGTDIVGTVTFCLLNEHDLPNYWNELVTGSILQAAVEAIVHFNLSSTSLLDAVCLGGMPRWFSAAYAIFIGCRNTSVANVERQLHPFREEVRRRGSRNEDVTEDDLALEESFSSFVRRYSKKNGFVTELFGVLSIVYAVVKMLVRLYHEIRLEDYDDEDGEVDASQYHPIWWLGLLWFVIMSVFQLAWINGVCIAIVKGQALMAEGSETASVNNLGITSAVQSSTKRVTKHDDGFKASEGDRDDLRSPLLKSECSSGCTDDTKSLTEKSDSESQVLESVKKCPEGATCETEYRAGWSDLLSLVRPDFVLMMTAFVFLLLAALTQILIPHYTGKILDSLAEYDDDFSSSGDDIWSVPGFAENIVKLVGAACLCGAFSGIRGAIFTVVGGRVNARIRTRLMDALLCQDIGFFDTTKSGDLSSRLCNDTTLVGDQVTLNINVFLRSFVQAVGVLIFMFLVSWQLTLLVFVSVPLITLSSKIYGKFMKRLTKLMQKRLADGNSISEAALSSMSTVRAFNAETSELEEYKKYMNRYLGLNLRAARAYVGYMTTITTLPLLITALVLFYGGLLVLSENNDDHISSGELVSFLLYLSSLTSAFNSMGNIFSSLTQAVGAADKVFEIMHRAPRSKRFRESSRSSASNAKRRVFTCSCLNKGLRPNMSTGDIKLNNVQMSYPARPSRQVLNGLTLSAPSGSVCALVGPSGGKWTYRHTYFQLFYSFSPTFS